MSPEQKLHWLCRAHGSTEPTRAELEWVRDSRHHVLPDRPPALFVDGEVDVLADPQLAVVGSRNPTAQGRDTAHDFARQLAGCGLGIVSGLAQGIDSAAHDGALAAQGITVAVLGSGIDVIYPRGNLALAAQIRRQGALLSEFALGAPPRREHFPRRNRLIAGLSLGTLVVEAAPRSGSLITARWAMERGREVFAVPGSIHNPLSRGCHSLIKQGAKLTETVDDILNELNFSGLFDSVPSCGATALHGGGSRLGAVAGMDKEHKILLDALGFDPVDLDTLVVRTGFKPETVSSMMLILELEGHVQAAHGGRYARVANRRAGGER